MSVRTFVIPFISDPDPNPEQEYIPDPVPLRQTVRDPTGSKSTTALNQIHIIPDGAQIVSSLEKIILNLVQITADHRKRARTNRISVLNPAWKSLSSSLCWVRPM
jgi:hypothetical protein